MTLPTNRLPCGVQALPAPPALLARRRRFGLRPRSCRRYAGFGGRRRPARCFGHPIPLSLTAAYRRALSHRCCCLLRIYPGAPASPSPCRWLMHWPDSLSAQRRARRTMVPPVLLAEKAALAAPAAASVPAVTLLQAGVLGSALWLKMQRQTHRCQRALPSLQDCPSVTAVSPQAQCWYARAPDSQSVQHVHCSPPRLLTHACARQHSSPHCSRCKSASHAAATRPLWLEGARRTAARLLTLTSPPPCNHRSGSSSSAVRLQARTASSDLQLMASS